MKVIYVLLLLIGYLPLSGQVTKVDKVAFFADEAPLEVTITLDMQKLLTKKILGYVLPARFECRFPDSTLVNERINVEVRGQFRRENCYIPPLKCNFKTPGSPFLSPLGTIKMVNPCDLYNKFDEYLLKEYMVYKMYQQFTDKSFRVRLLNITYADSSGRRKPLKSHAFFIEDTKDMARRNNCREWTGKISTEATNRKQMTQMALFAYMVGNTDWAVPANHNIKLIIPKNDSMARPYAVPYDFDYCGMVNAEYAVPDPDLFIKSVTERVYRGFPRSMEELNEALDVFKAKKDTLMNMIYSFKPLSHYAQKEMVNYLDDFYFRIERQFNIRVEFIENARSK